jgi:cation diffusion facilitator CzcD-associated flavoprotein CzcO
VTTVEAASRHVRVLVVGAGFAGVCAAIKLREAAVGDVVVLERAGALGGTWRDNAYPGAACDVPSQLYSYSFALDPGWTRTFSTQPQIRDYLERVARSHGVLDSLVLGCEVLDAHWDDEATRWQVDTSQGRWTADVLVPAVGALSQPRLPAIAGIEAFGGEVLHSSQWSPGVELAGKRVAVVGTGASAVQIVPAICGTAARVDVYQRSAPWVVPRRDRPYGPWRRAVYRRVPAARRLARGAVYWSREPLGLLLTRRPRLLPAVEAVARAHLARQVPDRALRARLTPDYRIGCKRILLSDDWYPALQRPDVGLVTDPIAEVRGHGVVTRDGTLREVDVLVLATGFRVVDSPAYARFHGRGGLSLTDAWAATGVQAYKGTAVAGFPNLFLLVGPNTGLGHSSMVHVIESQVAYLVDAVATMTAQHLGTVEVRRDVQDGWNAHLQARAARAVWSTGGCGSWYLDQHGDNRALWPGSPGELRRLTRAFDLAAYTPTVRARPAPVAGN